MGKLGESTQQFDDATLALCAQKASGRENLRLQGWQVESVTGGSEQGHAIQRISGVGEADGHSLSWSLILKTVTGGPKNSADPQGSHYWKREPLYYQSGVLADLPGGLRAPRCYACLERPGGYQLFLEDLQGEVAGLSWPVEYYYSAARALGQFNGAYLAGKPIPAAEWIPRQWMRAYLEEAAPNMDLYSRFKDHPFVKKAFGVFPPGLIHKAWEQRHEMMAALEQVPQTFCHQDAFSRNLFSESIPKGGCFVAIDWAYAGPAPLGLDLVPLVFASMALGTIPFTEGAQLAQLALEGYQEGLAETGWKGNPDLIRFAFSVGCFWRYPFGALVGEFFEWCVNEANYAKFENLFGISIEQFADFGAVGNTWCLPYYQEALNLKKALKL